MTAHMARGLFEYRVLHDPRYVFRSVCGTCKKITKYSREQIMGQIPPDDRPRPLAADLFWAYLLFESDAWKGRDHRAFLGDRVLVQRLTKEPGGDWYGILKSTSPYAPTLKIGNFVKGRPRGRLELCLYVVEDGVPQDIPKPAEVPRSSSFGMFVSPNDNDEKILGANIYCSNPSCNHIFSTMTFTKFKAAIAKEQEDEDLYDEVTFLATVKLACPRCGTVRVIDEHSFDGLYQET